MSFPRGPHVRDIFVGRDDRKENKGKSKGKYVKNHINNKPVKIGEYRPRILAEDELGNVPIQRSKPEDNPKAFIVGDKNTPIVLHPVGVDNEFIDSFPQTRHREIETSNPVFNRRDVGNIERSKIENGVVIPPPDYDDDIYSVIQDRIDYNKPVVRHYAGEDYSKFLEDDDDEHGGLTWRSEIHTKRGGLPEFDKKSKTEAKRVNRYQKKEPKSKGIFRTNKSGANPAKRNSLREFSFADSKGVEIEKRSSSLSRQISNGSKGSDDANNFLTSHNQSYESFLQAQHGANVVKDNNNRDNFVNYRDNYVQYHNHVNDTRDNWERYSPPNPHKDGNFWKRLTWKFRKQSSYTMAFE